jgi:hypothetical protein
VIWLFLAVLAVLICVLLACFEVAETDQQRMRAQRSRVERDLRRAERQLHDLASNAFGSLLDTARQARSDQWPK